MPYRLNCKNTRKALTERSYSLNNHGFSLIQVGILLTVASLMMTAMLPGYQTKLTLNKNSTTNMNNVIIALRDFQLANGRLPCPADASQLVGSANYGVEATPPYNNCTGGTPAANLVDAANNVAIGILPVKTLGLANEAALDNYGHYITYGVDTAATGCWASQFLPGNITVDDPDYGPSSGNGFTKNTVVALVSHGADGYGAFLPAVTNGTVNRLNAGSTDTDQALNAHVTAGTVTPLATSRGADSNNVTTTFINKKLTGTYDDIVVYNNKIWNINTIPYSLTTASSLTGPTNGTYSRGNTLTFTLTLPQAVTVTGTPRLAFSALTSSTYPSASVGTNNVAYATYAAGSSNPNGPPQNTLVFTYTVQTNDYAPIGITVSQPLNMNNNSAFVNPCYTFFTPPNLSGVLIVTNYFWVADSNNNRILQLTTTGTYLATLGSLGTSDYQFNSPDGVAIDTSGNMWVADGGNNRVMKFDHTGKWLMTIGGTTSQSCSGILSGTTCANLSGYTACCSPTAGSCTCSSGGGSGMFNVGSSNPQAVALDSSGNVWVTDFTNKRVQEFNPNTGAYMSQIALTGTPSGIAVDKSGYLWIIAPSDQKIRRCTTGGSCAYVDGTTRYNSFAQDSDYITLDPSGNIWASDESNCNIYKYSTSGSGSYTSTLSMSSLVTCSGGRGVDGIVFDGSGNFWIADENSAVQQLYNINPSTGAILQTLGTSGGGAGTTPTLQFSWPQVITYGP